MARDIFHKAVKTGLERSGWLITHDPYQISVGGVEMYIDLGAEALIGAEREGTRIAVEIKSFVGPSPISEFHAAHGQYLDYRYALDLEESDRILYLAVPVRIFEIFFTLDFIKIVIERSQLRLMIYNPDAEVIEKWQ